MPNGSLPDCALSRAFHFHSSALLCSHLVLLSSRHVSSSRSVLIAAGTTRSKITNYDYDYVLCSISDSDSDSDSDS